MKYNVRVFLQVSAKGTSEVTQTAQFILRGLSISCNVLCVLHNVPECASHNVLSVLRNVLSVLCNALSVLRTVPECVVQCPKCVAQCSRCIVSAE